MFQLEPFLLFNYIRYVVFFEIVYCHVFGVCVTNNNGFFIWWSNLLDLYTTWLQQFTNHYLTGHWNILTTLLLQLNWLHCTALLLSAVTDGQSASLSSNKAPIWGLRPDFYYCQTAAGLLMWDALSDERTGLSFKIAACPRQRSNFQVRVPWYSWPYFTVSDSRLPFSSSPKTRMATVGVFDPASTRDALLLDYSDFVR
jgi:hypothetical protein